MQLLITKDFDFDPEFIYNYLPQYIRKLVIDSLDQSKLDRIDKEFDIDSFGALKWQILSHLRVSETSNEYIIKIDKNATYNGQSVELLLNIITFGNRSVQGYPIVSDIFNFVAENIETIYEDWSR